LQVFLEFSSNKLYGIHIVRALIIVGSTGFILRLTLLSPSEFVSVFEVLDCDKYISHKIWMDS
jgi:hypothetical protein